MGTAAFTAKMVYASKEEGYYLVGFADDEYETKEYVLLQKAFDFDEQDITLGMDGEYIEINGQENSGYKCCCSAVLSDASFVVKLEPGAGNFDEVMIVFDGIRITSDMRIYLTEILGSKLMLA